MSTTTPTPTPQAREVTSSNSTANLFLHGLGRRRGVVRAWMDPNAQSQPPSARKQQQEIRRNHCPPALRNIDPSTYAIANAPRSGNYENDGDDDLFVSNQRHEEIAAEDLARKRAAAESSALPSPALNVALQLPAGETNGQELRVQAQVDEAATADTLQSAQSAQPAHEAPEASHTQGQTQTEAPQIEGHQQTEVQTRTERQTQGQEPSASPTDASTTETMQTPVELQIDSKFWETAIEKATTILNHPPASDFHMPLVRLLRTACIQQDLFFLVLYQLFCFSKRQPAAYATLPDFVGTPTQGFRVVDRLLLFETSLSPDFLHWSFRFPIRPRIMMTNVGYRTAMKRVASCLTLMYERWVAYEAHVRARGYPPLVDEMAMTFSLYSPTLMYIMFVRLSHHMYQPDTKQKFHELFYENKRAFDRRVTTNTPSAPDQMERENKHLILAYLSLNPLFSLTRAVRIVSPWFGGSVDPTLLRAGGAVPVPQTISPLQATPARTQLTGTPVHSPSPYASPYPGAQNWPPRLQNFVATPVNPNLTMGGLHGHPVQAQMPLPQMTLPSHSTPSVQPSMLQLQLQPMQPVQQVQPQQMQHIQGQGQGQVRRAPNLDTHLLPAPGTTPVTTVCPNPLRIALHQAHLRDPQFRLFHSKEGHSGIEASSLVHHFSTFKAGPAPLGLVECTFSFQFIMDDFEYHKRTGLVRNKPGQRLTRLVASGDKAYRFRCIKSTSNTNADAIDEHIWNSTETSWPSVLYVFVNDSELFVRRKFHNGKDLPLDITDHLKQGTNNLTFHMLRNPAESRHIYYAAAIEVMDMSTESQARRLCRFHPPDRSRARLQRRLQQSRDKDQIDDDELSIVTDDMNIDLIDPFTARVWDLPARGTRCVHPECFDHRTFIHTRLNPATFVGPLKDNWKCPICSSYASPRNLLIDGFLVEVRNELVKAGKLDTARALKFRANGSYEVKFDPDTSTPDSPIGASSPASRAAFGGAGAGPAGTPTIPNKRKHDEIDPPKVETPTQAQTPGSISGSNAAMIELD